MAGLESARRESRLPEISGRALVVVSLIGRLEDSSTDAGFGCFEKQVRGEDIQIPDSLTSRARGSFSTSSRLVETVNPSPLDFCDVSSGTGQLWLDS